MNCGCGLVNVGGWVSLTAGRRPGKLGYLLGSCGGIGRKEVGRKWKKDWVWEAGNAGWNCERSWESESGNGNWRLVFF